LGTQTGTGGHAGWALLVRQGLAAFLSTASAPKPTPLLGSSAIAAGVPPGLQSELTDILITMVTNHYP